MVVFCNWDTIILKFITIITSSFKINNLQELYITIFCPFITSLAKFVTTLHVKFCVFHVIL